MSNTANPTAAQNPAAATDAVLTLTAPTDGTRWQLFWVAYSYSATPTGGSITISWTIGATTYTETYAILVGGWGIMQWPQPRRFPANTTVTITLTSGAGAVVGKVYGFADTVN